MSKSTRAFVVLVAGWCAGIAVGSILGLRFFGLWSSFQNAIALSFLTAFAGPFIGLTSNAQHFTLQFKFMLVLGFAAAIAMFIIGISGPPKWWRWLSGVAGVNLWFVVGLVGCGPI